MIAPRKTVGPRFTVLLLASMLALAFAGGCGKKEQSEGMPAGSTPKGAASPSGTRVEVATVGLSKGAVSIVRPGEIKGAREAKLASALGGFVERVLVDTGAEVKKDQVLVYVDSNTHGAQAKLTRVELDEAKRELARVEGLGKAIASVRVDTARSRVARAQAQHTLSTTRQSRAAIRAPFAGVIVGLEVERGEVLAPGAPIGRLIQLDPLRVDVSVTDRDVVALRTGGDAYVTTAAVADPIKGTIARIEQAADLRTRTFRIEVSVDNADRRLLPGMIAQVSFAGKGRGDAIFLPQDLLVTQLDGNGVFIADAESIARWRPVTLGSIVGTDVEISSGIKAGERIVVHGHRGLADRDPLIITRQGTCCTSGRIVFDDPSRTAAPSSSDKAVGRDETSEEETADRTESKQ